MTTEREAERKYEAPAGFEAPDVPGLGRWGEPRTFELRAEYLDTADRALTRARWSLRRREGGHDEGWHLKSPGDDGARVERRLPLGDELPAAFAELVRPVVGDAALDVVAVLSTRRTARDLVADDGRVRAHLCDDHVEADAAGAVQRWHEIELELDPDEPLDTLDVLERAVLAAGCTPAPHGSKIGKALGISAGSAAGVLWPYLAKQVATIHAWEDGVRTDAPDAVHKTRVACRRLRGLLRTFDALFAPETVAWLTVELRWYGEVAGRPRDAEVLREHLAALLATLPADPERDGELLAALDARHAAAHADLVATLETPRYRALLAVLDSLVADPPLTEAGRRPGTKRLRRSLAQAVQKTEKRLAKAEQHPRRLAGWHEVRKAAKAVRYSLEALAELGGEDATRAAASWEAVTEHLGAVQDTVIAEETLTELADAAAGRGDPTDAFGVLIKAQRATRAEELARGRDAVRTALDADLTWLD